MSIVQRERVQSNFLGPSLFLEFWESAEIMYYVLRSTYGYDRVTGLVIIQCVYYVCGK